MRCFALITAVSLTGCVLDAEHVSTKLVQICTRDIPLLFEASDGGMTAQVRLEGVGRSVDAEASATLDTLVLEPIDGIDDLGFADTMTVTLTAPGSALPDLRIAETSMDDQVPLVVTGDASANMADYLGTEELWLRARLAGGAPVAAFTARIQACLDVDGVEVEDI